MELLRGKAKHPVCNRCFIKSTGTRTTDAANSPATDAPMTLQVNRRPLSFPERSDVSPKRSLFFIHSYVTKKTADAVAAPASAMPQPRYNCSPLVGEAQQLCLRVFKQSRGYRITSVVEPAIAPEISAEE